MLVSFSVSNFRSIGEEVTLNMVASGRLTDHPSHLVKIPGTDKSLVRTAVMYGANAAGKSNVIRAMKALQERVLFPHDSGGRFASRFKLGREFADAPSSFEFRFVAANHVFTYGADFKSSEVESEWLTVLDGEREVVLFERDGAGQVTENSVQASRLLADNQMVQSMQFVALAPLRPTDLALTRAKELPPLFVGRTIKSVLDWFESRLTILDNSEDATGTLKTLGDTPSLQGVSEEFLRRVGTGVSGLALETEVQDAGPWERLLYLRRKRGSLRVSGDKAYTDVRFRPEDRGRVDVRTLKSRHQSDAGDVLLDFSEESDGTRLLLKYMPIFGASKDSGRVFVIDELDGSLHPMVCHELIQAFAESCPDRNRQLIVTTHEAHLLDQDLLRRDEYWFVEKDDKQQTRLTSLSDFNVRNDLQLRKGYLQGRFGGIPVLGSDERLRELLQCEALEEDQQSVEAAGGTSDAS